MICWICGTKDREEPPLASLIQKLGIEDISAIVRSRRLRGYGHVHRATSGIESVDSQH